MPIGGELLKDLLLIVAGTGLLKIGKDKAAKDIGTLIDQTFCQEEVEEVNPFEVNDFEVIDF